MQMNFSLPLTCVKLQEASIAAQMLMKTQQHVLFARYV